MLSERQKEVDDLKNQLEVLDHEIDDWIRKTDLGGLTASEDEQYIKAVFKHMEITGKLKIAKMVNRAYNLDLEID